MFEHAGFALTHLVCIPNVRIYNIGRKSLILFFFFSVCQAGTRILVLNKFPLRVVACLEVCNVSFFLRSALEFIWILFPAQGIALLNNPEIYN